MTPPVALIMKTLQRVEIKGKKLPFQILLSTFLEVDLHAKDALCRAKANMAKKLELTCGGGGEAPGPPPPPPPRFAVSQDVCILQRGSNQPRNEGEWPSLKAGAKEGGDEGSYPCVVLVKVKPPVNCVLFQSRDL